MFLHVLKRATGAEQRKVTEHSNSLKKTKETLIFSDLKASFHCNEKEINLFREGSRATKQKIPGHSLDLSREEPRGCQRGWRVDNAYSKEQGPHRGRSLYPEPPPRSLYGVNPPTGRTHSLISPWFHFTPPHKQAHRLAPEKAFCANTAMLSLANVTSQPLLLGNLSLTTKGLLRPVLLRTSAGGFSQERISKFTERRILALDI